MPDPDWKTKKVLIVDNDAEFVALAKTALLGVGVPEARSVGSVPEAVKLLAEFPADLVVVEISLPRINGAQLVRVLRDRWRSPNPDILIIVMVASAKADSLRQACDAGVENFIRKPVTAEGLLKRIAATLVRPTRFVAADGYFGPDRRLENGAEFDGAERRESKAPPPVRSADGESEKRDWSLVEDATDDDETPVRAQSEDVPLVEEPVPQADADPRGDGEGGPLADKPAAPAKTSKGDWSEALGEDEAEQETAIEPGAEITGALEEHAKWLQTKGKEGSKASFAGADLSGVDLAGVNLANANLREANLADANCRAAVFQGADMRRANLSGTQVGEADMAVAVMRHTDMQLAQLQGANLRGTDLSGANLKGAGLGQADLSGATLLSTDLRETDLSGALGLTQTQVNRAVVDSSTQLPPGLRRPQAD